MLHVILLIIWYFRNVILIMSDSENIVSDGEFFGNTFDKPKEGVE